MLGTAERNNFKLHPKTYYQNIFANLSKINAHLAIAKYNEKEDTIHFKGVLLSIDGKQKLTSEKNVDISEWKKLGFHAAQEILNNGGTALMAEIKQHLNK
jgi:porphobilinogen deaminase